MCEPRFVPKKWTAMDGKTWWGIYDNKWVGFSSLIRHGRRYKTKRDAQFCIDYMHKHYAEYGY